VGPVGRTTWASFGARTLKFTFVDVVVIGLKWYSSTLFSVLHPVENNFHFTAFFWFSQMAAQILGFHAYIIVSRISNFFVTG